MSEFLIILFAIGSGGLLALLGLGILYLLILAIGGLLSGESREH